MEIKPLIIEKANWNGLRTIKDIWIDLVIDKQITWDEYDRVQTLTHTEQQDELNKYDYQKYNK